MKKFFAWMQSTGGFASYIALAIILTCLVIIYGSVIFHWNNFYSITVHAANGWWHVVGWFLTCIAVIQAIKMNERGSIIFFGVTLALSFCAFAGFNF